MKSLNLTNEEIEMLHLSLCGTIRALEDELDEMQATQAEFFAKNGRKNSILAGRMSSRRNEIETHKALLDKLFALKFDHQ